MARPDDGKTKNQPGIEFKVESYPTVPDPSSLAYSSLSYQAVEDPVPLDEAADSVMAEFLPVFEKVLDGKEEMQSFTGSRILFNKTHSRNAKQEARIVHNTKFTKGLRVFAYELAEDSNYRSFSGYKEITPQEFSVIGSDIIKDFQERCGHLGLSMGCFKRLEGDVLIAKGQRTDMNSKRELIVELSFSLGGKAIFRRSAR